MPLTESVVAWPMRTMLSRQPDCMRCPSEMVLCAAASISALYCAASAVISVWNRGPAIRISYACCWIAYTIPR